METRYLNEDEMVILFNLGLIEDVDGLFADLLGTDGGWVLQAIEKRFKAYNMEVDKRVMITILTIGNGVVGKCAKYVDDIVVKWRLQFANTKIDYNTFSAQIYSDQIPNF